MARKMKKFSAGGAQGRYDRRMADIDKDFTKDSKGKSGRALEVLEAKRAQRKADAEDDRAKRTGADRTATRKAEYDAEKNLSRTRKFGADKPAASNPDMVAQARAVAAADAPAAEKAKAKPQSFGAAFQAARAKAIKEGRDPNKEIFTWGGKKKVALMATTPKPVQKAVQKAAATTPKPAATTATTPKPAATTPKPAATTATVANKPLATGALNSPTLLAAWRADTEAKKKADKKKADDAKAKQVAANAKRFASRNVQSAYGAAGVKLAKGGTVKKETTMSKKPTPIGGKHLMPTKKKPIKEPITGGANTVPLTPGRKEFLKELAERNAKPGMAKGGKATKFGAAMTKKSADTKGRAMVKKCSGGSMKKYAKGGSIDGIAVKGKTKAKRVTMKKGGSC